MASSLPRLFVGVWYTPAKIFSVDQLLHFGQQDWYHYYYQQEYERIDEVQRRKNTNRNNWWYWLQSTNDDSSSGAYDVRAMVVVVCLCRDCERKKSSPTNAWPVV